MRSCLDGLRILEHLDPYSVYFHAKSMVRWVTRDGDLLIDRFVEGKALRVWRRHSDSTKTENLANFQRST